MREALVAVGNQGVGQGSDVGDEVDVADFVADQQRDPAQPVELGVQPADALYQSVSVSVEFRTRVDAPPYSTMSRPCAVNAQITVTLIAMSVIDQTG
jgi:hypothetical protein